LPTILPWRQRHAEDLRPGTHTRGGLLTFEQEWSQLLRKTFEIDTICPRCKSPLRLIALIKTEDTIKRILAAMGLPTEAPKPYPARPPPSEPGDGAEHLN
jgi:hypothetical protein